MSDNPPHLTEHLAHLPTQPGVYLMRDQAGQLLYIGKALVLANRVRSYFQNRVLHGPKITKMVAFVHTIETIVTNTEIEALLLEERLIRQHQPRYNTLLKTGQGFPYIKLTWQEDYPRIQVVRKRASNDKSLYFGPYPSSHAVHQLVNAIREIFPVEKCPDPRKEKRLCLYYDMKKCLGHCQQKVTASDYKDMLQGVRLFLEGKSTTLQILLEERMQVCAQQMRYEEAAQYRDALRSLHKFIQPGVRQHITGPPDLNVDAIHLATNAFLCHVELFPVRDGYLQPPYLYDFPITEWTDPTELLTRFLYSYYTEIPQIPPTILIPFELPESDILVHWLSTVRGQKVQLKQPLRGYKKDLLDLVEKNTHLGLLKSESNNRHRIAHESLNELQELLHLESRPLRIEAFDISHFQGQETVASMVVFSQGYPDKKAYRRFKIRSTLEGVPNDFLSMEEVVARRYAKITPGQEPDLILIDGGRGQVNSALMALKQIGYQPKALIGLAKKEELIILPDQSEPIALPRHRAALRLLQQVRDESHRFAITYHRLLRGKRALHSELDDIQGIGTKRKAKLLQQFGSIATIKTAGIQELMMTGQLPRQLAELVYHHFRGNLAS